MAFVIERLWKLHEESVDRQQFLPSVKNEPEKGSTLLKGVEHLLKTDIWQFGISTGLVKLISYEVKMKLTSTYFQIEFHNYEA